MKIWIFFMLCLPLLVQSTYLHVPAPKDVVDQLRSRRFIDEPIAQCKCAFYPCPCPGNRLYVLCVFATFYFVTRPPSFPLLDPGPIGREAAMFFSIAGKTINDKCCNACEPVPKEGLLNANKKNRQQIACKRCRSLIFPNNVVGYIEGAPKELKKMSVGGGEKLPSEKVSWWWCTESDLDFDTVGWQTIDGQKVLMCGDCEFGPFGWREEDNKKFYVAVERVAYI
ncbi:hypothetical protein QR680_013715 [Steinernema hermaphroditum]|uniref:Mss4-like protein n=1 Tax=Steinernema hermaphroditum TaxID=289476 RepID=A0AA39I980_9BILA|nr:hypothetical protein QR680_013715 [Steinernema hermaphroditum]